MSGLGRWIRSEIKGSWGCVGGAPAAICGVASEIKRPTFKVCYQKVVISAPPLRLCGAQDVTGDAFLHIFILKNHPAS